jgi:hypothetical protein
MSHVNHKPSVQRQSSVKQAVTTAPLALNHNQVASMVSQRRDYQVVKFRSTCSDCVPNL